MQIKKIAMMVAAVCAVGFLSGCGIPEEEHNAMIAQLQGEKTDLEDQLKGKIADLESIVESEKAKVRTGRIELDDASERIKDLQQKSAETSKMLAETKSNVAQLESELAKAKSAILAAQDLTLEAEEKYSTLDVEHQELKRRFEMYQKNMSAMSSASIPASSSPSASSAAPSGAPASTAPQSDAQKAQSLLNEMSTF